MSAPLPIAQPLSRVGEDPSEEGDDGLVGSLATLQGRGSSYDLSHIFGASAGEGEGGRVGACARGGAGGRVGGGRAARLLLLLRLLLLHGARALRGGDEMKMNTLAQGL